MGGVDHLNSQQMMRVRPLADSSANILEVIKWADIWFSTSKSTSTSILGLFPIVFPPWKQSIDLIMPRSATDATRFTSTTPHAHTKPPPSAANINRGTKPARTPGPPGETPQEKVRRLRAAADRARDAQVTTFDKLLVRGRVWADRAHRFTALSLIGATCMDFLSPIISSRSWDSKLYLV